MLAKLGSDVSKKAAAITRAQAKLNLLSSRSSSGKFRSLDQNQREHRHGGLVWSRQVGHDGGFRRFAN